jgi:hypothetical protein
MKKIGVSLLVLCGLAAAATGARYFFATEFMPYHAAVAGRTWPQIDQGTQTVISGMLKVIGAGFLGGGVSLLCFAYSAARGERWPALGALLVGMSVWGPTLYVTILLRQASPGAETPMVPSILILLLIVVAALLLWRGSSPHTQRGS